jgi:imidazolonepropionase-like amidohydrolase
MEMYYKIYLVKKQTIKRYFDAGGKITIGSDHPSTGDFISGFFGHREIAHLVMCGIPPAAALKAATFNAANAMNVGQKLGTVEAGKFADLCIVRGNPLEDIHNTHNVRLVMKAGELYDSALLLKSVEGKLGPRSEDDWQ